MQYKILICIYAIKFNKRCVKCFIKSLHLIEVDNILKLDIIALN